MSSLMASLPQNLAGEHSCLTNVKQLTPQPLLIQTSYWQECVPEKYISCEFKEFKLVNSGSSAVVLNSLFIKHNGDRGVVVVGEVETTVLEQQ